MKTLNLFAAFVLLLTTTGTWATSNVVPETIPGTMRISAEELVDLYGNHPEAILVDSRTVEDFKRGYIEGAISLPDTDTTQSALSRVAGDKNQPVVFYCNGVKCGRSAVAANLAVQWGYSKVYWFRGGMVEWQDKHLPIVR